MVWALRRRDELAHVLLLDDVDAALWTFSARLDWKSESIRPHRPKSSELIFHLSSDDIVKWDMAETAKGGPFPEILDG